MKVCLRALCRTASIAIAAASIFLSTNVSAQALAQQIVGTWIAVSQYVDQDGKKLEPFGSDPKGMVVYDSNGRFILVLQRATLPKFASNNRMTGTDLLVARLPDASRRKKVCVPIAIPSEGSDRG